MTAVDTKKPIGVQCLNCGAADVYPDGVVWDECAVCGNVSDVHVWVPPTCPDCGALVDNEGQPCNDCAAAWENRMIARLFR